MPAFSIFSPAGKDGGSAGGKVKFDRLGRQTTYPHGESSVGWMLELHKALWLPIGVCSMVLTGNYGHRATLMTGLFGAYGIMWVLKSNIFPDLNFYNTEQSRLKSWPHYIAIFAMIGVYFLYPVLAVTHEEDLGPLAASACPLMFCLGGFLHWAGDAQRYFELKYNPGKLITDGFFAHVRHPSYLGEILMWVALSVLAGPKRLLSWVPLAWLLIATVALGIPVKEKSLSRYPEFSAWAQRVPMLWPRIFAEDLPSVTAAGRVAGG